MLANANERPRYSLLEYHQFQSSKPSCDFGDLDAPSVAAEEGCNTAAGEAGEASGTSTGPAVSAAHASASSSSSSSNDFRDANAGVLGSDVGVGGAASAARSVCPTSAKKPDARLFALATVRPAAAPGASSLRLTQSATGCASRAMLASGIEEADGRDGVALALPGDAPLVYVGAASRDLRRASFASRSLRASWNADEMLPPASRSPSSSHCPSAVALSRLDALLCENRVLLLAPLLLVAVELMLSVGACWSTRTATSPLRWADGGRGVVSTDLSWK